MRKSPNIEISELDLGQIFSDDHEITGNRIPKILQIPLDMIDEFPDHPFQVRLDEDMDQLVESIKERGVITPVTLRKKEDGRYETVSGHRRVKASELAGLDTVPAEIKDLTRDEAIILMVDSNLQRSTILPSEKAKSYKMRLEAMKRQAGRPPKNNLVPVGQNYSREELSSQTGESQTQIQQEIDRRMDRLPGILKEDGYPDVQTFKRTYDDATVLVEQYNRDLAAWEQQINSKGKTKPQQKPPEKESIRKLLRDMEAEAKRRNEARRQEPRHRSHDYDRGR